MKNTTSHPKPSNSVDFLVDRLFQRFALMYGSIWLDRYCDLPMDLVKGEWSDSLRGMTSEQMRLALDHCRTHVPLPPTLPEFVSLCRQFRGVGPSLALTSPRDPMPENVRDFIADFVRKKKAQP